MARYDGELKAAGEADPLDIVGPDLLDGANGRSRQEAVACYLSGSHGWQDAIKLLRGTFAPEQQGQTSRLTSGKAN